MSDEQDEAFVLRSVAHRMSQGIETKSHKRHVRTFPNTFQGTDAVEWLIADSKSGVTDLDGAIQVGQRLIEHGYIVRVSRELKFKNRHFGHSKRAKIAFRGGDSLYRFDTLRISPFQLHVTVRRARGLKSMDLNGKNDPYVELKLGTQRWETSVDMKTNDPVWNQRFVFGVHSVEAQQLQVSVWDYDKFKHDDHIGSCKIGLSHLPCSEAVAGDDPADVGASGDCPGSARHDGASETRVASESGSESSYGSDSGSRPRSHSSAKSGVGGRVLSLAKAGGKAFKARVVPEAPQNGRKKAGGGDAAEGGAHRRFGSQEEGLGPLTYYRLLATNEKRLLKEDARLASQVDDVDKPSCGEVALDIRITSFQPKPLPVQGEAKFSIRCRIWDMYGVTSSEERNLMTMNGTVVKQKVVLMLYEDRVSSGSFERSKEEKKTSFNGSVISLDTKANMATDMVKFVVQQKVSPVEIAYKPVATIQVPLRIIPVVFPEDGGAANEPAKAFSDQEKLWEQQEEGEEGTTADQGQRGDSFTNKVAHRVCGTVKSRTSLSSSSSSGGGGGGGRGGSRAPSHGSSGSLGPAAGGERRRPPATARRYRLQTLAGPMTTRTMGNGFVIMSLALVASGNDLLGEPDELDNEDVKVPPPPPPDALTDGILDASLNCGYQRLRKALLWNDSKLMAALSDVLNLTDVKQSAWVDMDGKAAAQDDLTGCKRERSFINPKSAMVAATRVECSDIVLADGPSLMAFESRSRTPAVTLGDKFTVVKQYVLTKQGPAKCRLQTSSQTDFSEKVMGFVQNQIVSAVTKVSKENDHHLLGLVEDAIIGKGSGPAGRKASAQGSRASAWLWCLGVLGLVLAALFLSASPRMPTRSQL